MHLSGKTLKQCPRRNGSLTAGCWYYGIIHSVCASRQLEAECRRMYLYLQKLAKERDEYHLVSSVFL